MSLTIVHLGESFAPLTSKVKSETIGAMDTVSIAWLALFVLFFGAVVNVRRRRRSGRPDPATSGAIHEMLDEDKRKAIDRCA